MSIVVQEQIVVRGLISQENVVIPFRVGVDGVTYSPSITEVDDETTLLEFTNDGGLSNPAATNIKGRIGNTPTISQSTGQSTTLVMSQKAITDELDNKVDKAAGERLINAAEITLLGNTSGVNSGNETKNSIESKLGAAAADNDGYLSSAKYSELDAKPSKDYVDGLVVGLLDDRGSYDASGNAWPTTGGSGTDGAILKGDLWYISVEGTLGGVVARVGCSIRALVDAPAQTAESWDMLNVGLGFVPENVANKVTSLSAESTNTQYAGAKATYDQFALTLSKLLLLKHTTPVFGQFTYTTPTPIACNASLPTPAVDTKYVFSSAGLCTMFTDGQRMVSVGDEMVILVSTINTVIYIRNPNNSLSLSDDVRADKLIQAEIIKTGYGVSYVNGGTNISSKYSTYFGNCKGADILEVSMPGTTSATSFFGIAFYDSNDAYLYGYGVSTGNTTDVREIKTYYLKDGVDHFRMSYYNASYIVAQGAFYAKLYCKNYISKTLDQRQINYGQGIVSADGTTLASTSLGCTHYIPCLGVKRMIIKMPTLASATTLGLHFYTSTKVGISGIPITISTDGVETLTLTRSHIPNDAAYFRVTYWNFDNSLTYGDFSCVVDYEEGFLGGNKYLPIQLGQLNFSVKVNQGVSNFWDETANNQEPESFKASTAVLVLPDNYSEVGEKIKLIMFCHGMSRAVSYQFWGAPATDNTTWLAQKERFRLAGFAVCDCNGSCDDNGDAVYANGAPQAVDGYRKTYEYIIEHYNIDPEIYVIGASMGGLVALNYCFHFNNVRALALLSPWTSLYYCGWGQGVKSPFVTFYGFNDTTTYEEDKVRGYDPYLRIQSVNNISALNYHKHPIKLWIGATEDSSVLYPCALAYMTAMKNASSDAQIRILDGVGHEITNGGCEVSDDEVIIWFNKH